MKNKRNTMSSTDNINDALDKSCCCASCGIAEIDDIKLKECGDCDLVRYCSDECLRDHKSEHKEECKKRAVELRDELFSCSRRALMWETVRSVCCLCRLI